jgi:hypothetical protein
MPVCKSKMAPLLARADSSMSYDSFLSIWFWCIGGLHRICFTIASAMRSEAI